MIPPYFQGRPFMKTRTCHLTSPEKGCRSSMRRVEHNQGTAVRAKRGILLWLGLSACLTGPAVASATAGAPEASIPPFVAEGTISTRIYADSRTTNATMATEATVLFWYSNGWWQAECTFTSPERVAGLVQNCSRISDGVRYRTFQSKQGRDNAGGVWPSAYAIAVPFPPAHMGALLVTWLALCPNAELPIIDEKRIRRFSKDELLNEPKNVGTYSSRSLETGSSFLSELLVTNNGFYFGPDDKPIRHPEPFADGHLELAFEVTARTNIAGITFPLSAAYSRFVPRQQGKSKEDLRLGALTRLEISRIGGFDTDELREHALPTTVIALDRRATNLPAGVTVNHIVTDDHWVPAKDARMTALVGAYTAGAKPPRTHYWITLVVFAPLAMLLVTIYLLRKRPVNKPRKDQTLV